MRSLAWMALLVAFPAAAEMAYKIIGADGAIIYTDRPVPGATEIRIPKPSSYAPRELPVTLKPAEPEPVVGEAYSEIRITRPEQDATVHGGEDEGGVDVDVSLEPALQEGHTLTYAVDGNETAKGLRTTRVRITDLERGSHHLDVTVRDEAGVLVGRSPRVTFHVRRPSVNDPRRREQGAGAPPPGGYKPTAPGGYQPGAPAGYAPGPPGKPPYAPGTPGTYNPATPATYAPSYAPTPPR